MKDYVNWAILAPGRIAAKMAEAMNGAGAKNGIRTYAVASRNIERAQEFAAKWHFQKAFGSYGELFSDPEVDAIYIANPHAFHYDSAMMALESGKHVLCEKPAGCSMRQLSGMLETAVRKQRFFMEAMWTAFNPCLAEVRRYIGQGAIGAVQHIDSRFCNRNSFDPHDRNYDPNLAGGALLDLGIYCIYFSMMMADFSPVERASSSVRMRGGVDAWNSGNLSFANTITASFQSAMDMPSPGSTHDAVIYGTEGYITVPNFFMAQQAEVHTYKDEKGNGTKVAAKIKKPFSVNGYEYELIHATRCILDGKTESDVHTFAKSQALCAVMDGLRSDWGMKYTWEE